MQGANVAFLFTHPVIHTMITGTVSDVTGAGLHFAMFRPELADGLEPGMLLPRCSLRLGEDIIRVSCRIVSPIQPMHLAFHSLEGEDRGLLLSYLASHDA